jgi:hypothetical protein
MKPQPDTKLGNYYVTIHDGARFGFLAGPFKDDHQTAIDLVARCQELAIQLDPWAHFSAFGTARIDYDYDKPGKLNAHLGLAPGCAPSCTSVASAEETNNAVSAETTHTEKGRTT